MTDKQKQVVDYLNHCKNVFLSSDWDYEKSLGMSEVTDQLENISDKWHNCYVSFLFAELTDEDKEVIDRELDFYVNYNGLYAVYDLV